MQELVFCGVMLLLCLPIILTLYLLIQLFVRPRKPQGKNWRKFFLAGFLCNVFGLPLFLQGGLGLMLLGTVFLSIAASKAAGITVERSKQDHQDFEQDASVWPPKPQKPL